MSGGLRIDSLWVHGFGHFSDYTRPLGPGLNVLYGPNEAGKSTLLAFLRGMLFGFDKRGRSEARYTPEAGAFGGELLLSTASGPLRLRRMMNRRGKAEATLLGPEGLALPASRLDEALARVTRELFCEVFAFGLEELSSFEKLAEEDGVSRALFAAGLRGARRLPEVEKHLEKRTEGLFKRTGKNPELNQVLQRLEEVRARLDAWKDRPARYLEERERLVSLERQREETEAQRDALARELERLSRLESVLGDLGELARSRLERAELPDLSDFPPGGVVRLEELLQRCKEARAALARNEELGSSARNELGRLSADSRVRERAQELRSALEVFTARTEFLRALPSRRAALAARRREVEQSLSGLGLKLDAQALLSLELGAAARGSLEALADQLSAAEAEWREAESTLGRVRAEGERIEASLKRFQVKRTLLPNLSAAELRRWQEALARVRPLKLEREQVMAQSAEQRQRLQSLRAQVEPEPESAPAPTLVLLGAGIALLCVAVQWHQSGSRAGVMALVGALLLLVPWVLGHRRASRDHARRMEELAGRQRQHAQEVHRVQSALETLAGRQRGLERELEVAASEVGDPFIAEGLRARREGTVEIAAGALRGVEDTLAEALRQEERVEHLRREREVREAERDAALREAQVAELTRRRAGVVVEALREELAELLEERGFPSDLSASRALALWREVAELRRRLTELRIDERTLAMDEAEGREVVERLREEARAAGLSEEPVESLSVRVAAALEEVKARDAEARGVRVRVEELAAERARLARLLESETQALSALWAQGGCDAEEPFRQRARQAERFEGLTQRVRELTCRIEAATGLEEARAREALAVAGGEEGARERLGQLRLLVPARAERLKTLLTEYGSARSQLAQWEGDEQLATLRIQEEGLRARAAELATRYAQDRLALALLSRARRRFEEEQQPRVIQLASEYFAALTQGRYRRVFIPAGGTRELRVTHAGGEKHPEQLSRGTREQLYLAFRLAVIQDFGETRGALPLIVDDILVNFDLERTRGTLQVLARLSERHQVISFTCHPWVRELFEEQGARVVELASSAPPFAVPPGTTEPLRLFG